MKSEVGVDVPLQTLHKPLVLDKLGTLRQSEQGLTAVLNFEQAVVVDVVQAKLGGERGEKVGGGGVLADWEGFVGDLLRGGWNEWNVGAVEKLVMFVDSIYN